MGGTACACRARCGGDFYGCSPQALFALPRQSTAPPPPSLLPPTRQSPTWRASTAASTAARRPSSCWTSCCTRGRSSRSRRCGPVVIVRACAQQGGLQSTQRNDTALHLLWILTWRSVWPAVDGSMHPHRPPTPTPHPRCACCAGGGDQPGAGLQCHAGLRGDFQHAGGLQLL